MEEIMRHIRFAAVIGTAAITAVGLAALAGCGTTTAKAPAAAATPATPAAAATPADPSYSYYQAMMERLHGGGSMMGGSSYSWMMGAAGYRWMMGGAAAPAWMSGQALPRFMMGSSSDPGKVMGSLFANAPGPRVSAAQAAQLGGQVPAGATLDRAANRITITGTSVQLTVLASPSGGPDETFRVAGMVNPDIIVTAGAHVTIQVINADPDTAHGLVVTASDATSWWMPMMTAAPAFPGSALWFLGNPTSAGLHAGTLTFTAGTPGTYHYLCPVPGHAQKGMAGAFIVR
jgi:rusticyanin